MNYLKIICLFSSLLLQACLLGSNDYFTISPLKTYAIQFEESEHEQSSHNTDITIVKNGRRIADKTPFPLPSSLPNKLTKYYPNITWDSDNILRLASFARLEKKFCDSLSIYNATNKTISYLRVDGGINEELVIIELQPKTAIEIFLKSPTLLGGDRRWIGVIGYFPENQITRGGLDFQNKEMSKVSAHYCVVIEESEVNISSLEFEGIATHVDTQRTTSNTVSGTIIIPKSKGCNK